MYALLCAKAPAQGKQAPCIADALQGRPPYGDRDLNVPPASCRFAGAAAIVVQKSLRSMARLAPLCARNRGDPNEQFNVAFLLTLRRTLPARQSSNPPILPRICLLPHRTIPSSGAACDWRKLGLNPGKYWLLMPS
jgi:hypothetical protein